MTRRRNQLLALALFVTLAVPAAQSFAGAGNEPGCGAAPACCYNPCIRYVTSGAFRPCGPPVQTVLVVKDPATCCTVEVPVCLPANTTGEPCVDWKVGALGNGKVFYSWCNGVELKLIFTKCGDITVVYLRA